MVSSRSSVPVVRSRSIAIEVTRNIETSGNTPSSGPPTRSKTAPACPPANTYLSRATSAHGTATRSSTVRGSCRSWSSTRRAVAVVTRRLTRLLGEPKKGLLELVLARPLAQLRRCQRREQGAVSEEEQVVAARGLLHDVARDEQRRAAVGEPPE